MLTTSIFGLKKPQTSDAPSALRTAIGDNADLLEALLDRRGYAEVLTDENNNGTTTVMDPTTPGPQVTITVPTNGLVLVKAEVGIGALGVTNSQAARVYLYEDGALLSAIIDTPSTPLGAAGYTLPGNSAGTTAKTLSGFLAFPAAAGSRTYKLRYSSTGAPVSAMKNRKLWVRALAF